MMYYTFTSIVNATSIYAMEAVKFTYYHPFSSGALSRMYSDVCVTGMGTAVFNHWCAAVVSDIMIFPAYYICTDFTLGPRALWHTQYTQVYIQMMATQKSSPWVEQQSHSVYLCGDEDMADIGLVLSFNHGQCDACSLHVPDWIQMNESRGPSS